MVMCMLSANDDTNVPTDVNKLYNKSAIVQHNVSNLVCTVLISVFVTFIEFNK